MSALPAHIAIIMDGNRRWAKEKGLPSLQGHQAGFERLKATGDACLARGIKFLTVFAFSTENWRRAAEEVGYLMNLIEVGVERDLPHFVERNVKLKIIGRRDGLSPNVLRALDKAEAATANGTAATFGICLNYGGRAEIVDATKKLLAEGVKPEELTEERFAQALYWPEMPDPDLIVRTSGEERLSGFLTWQSAYGEIYWCQKHWPDFDEAELDKALEVYARRRRRYGA
jgi:undecaprenyl diphosphate synthase